MGRPLFSSPAVRVEPEQPAQHPTLEKWTYWKPFDPDSDEFFVNPIDERFLDSVQVQQQADATRAASPIGEDSSSSEGSSSGRASPAADEDAEEEVDVTRETAASIISNLTREMAARGVDINEELDSPPPLRPVTPDYDEIDMYESLSSRVRDAEDARAVSETYIGMGIAMNQSSRSRSPPGQMFGRDTRRTSPMPIPRPVTPPSYSSYNWGSPSPVGSITPRNFFTWSTLNSTGSPNGPLTNRSARMSVSNIAPISHTASRIYG